MKADAAMEFDDRSDSVSAAAGKSTAISTTASTSTTAMSDDGNEVPNPRPGASEMPPLVPLSEPSSIGKAEPNAVTNDTPENEDKKGHTQNATGGPSLVGKINNLISSDLKNIIGMTELPMIIVYTPLKIVISVYFLYRLLGWRYGSALFHKYGHVNLWDLCCDKCLCGDGPYDNHVFYSGCENYLLMHLVLLIIVQANWENYFTKRR